MSLTAADFNADGNRDLIATNSINGLSPVMLLGYSHGAFNAVTLNGIEITAVSSAAGDLNSDGKLDLVIDGASTLPGSGGGTFTQGASLDTSGGAVTAADFNGDGDLAVCNPAENTVTIVLGNGDGTFTTASDSLIGVGTQPWAIVVGDFNNDGEAGPRHCK